MKYLLFFIFTTTFGFSQENIDVLYNAAVEKYIKKDYDKAVEYMEKVYSLSPQQKYKNFIIKILYEAANSSYMKQNYKKAYEYTSKALKYTTEDEKINQLHKILSDILKKEETVAKKLTETPAQKQLQQQKEETKPKEQKDVEQKPKFQITTEKPVQQETKVVIVENKKYKFLFFITLSLFSLSVILFILYQFKIHLKTKKLLQQQIEVLKKENFELKTQLIEAKKEVDIYKEKEKMYQQQIKHYETELKEKESQISALQEKIITLSKTSVIQPQTKPQVSSKAKIEAKPITDKQQEQILSFLSTIGKPELYTEYELEIYREKLASMLKTLFEVNPQKTYAVLHQMINNENPVIRANVVLALIEIGSDETFSMLFNLYERDTDTRVKGEIIKQLVKLKQKIVQNKVSLPESIKQKVLSLLDEEKKKGEWLF
jgi:tetratricopeptide (TPR) repeat protein